MLGTARLRKNRIVKIPTGEYTTTDFDLNDEGRDWLYQSGYEVSKQFLKSWNLEDYLAQRMQHST